MKVGWGDLAWACGHSESPPAWAIIFPRSFFPGVTEESHLGLLRGAPPPASLAGELTCHLCYSCTLMGPQNLRRTAPGEGSPFFRHCEVRRSVEWV